MKTDGRWIVFACVTLYLLFVAVLAGPLHGGRVTVLQTLGVPALDPVFSDTLCVAHWCDGYGRGEDPASPAFKDPDGKVISMNYPRVFLGFHYLGLCSGRIIPWGILLGGIFLAAALVLCGRCTRWEGFIWALALLSPSVVMAVERGNFDCLIFGLLVASGLLMARPGIAGIVTLGATALKIYPAAALAALVIRRQPAVRITAIYGLLAVVLGGYLMIANGHAAGDLGETSCCFGSKVVMMILSPRLGMSVPWVGLASQAVALLLMILGICGGYLLISRSVVASQMDHDINFFWTGVPVYLLVFLSGDQADYKMIFGLFALPAMTAWIRMGTSDRWIPKTWILLFLLFSYWLFFSDEGSLRNMLLRQTVAWIFFAVTSVTAGALIPALFRFRGWIGNRA